jgi:putative MATE family efflux protein
MKSPKAGKPVHSLTEGSVIQAVRVLAVPTIVGNLLQNLHTVIDIYFIGKLGPESIAAVSLGGVVIDVLWTVIAGLSLGFRALISRAAGAKNLEQAAHIANQAILLVFLISIPLAIAGAIYARPITIFLGAEPAVVPVATIYFRVIIGSAFLYLTTHTASAILHALGEARIPAQAMLLITVITFSLEPLLIFGWGPVPGFGVAGAAMTLVACYTVAGSYLFFVLARGHRGVKLSFQDMRADWPLLVKILKIGLPRTFQRSFRAFGDIAMIKIVAGFGTHTLAAYGVAMRIVTLVNSPGWAMASVASTMVGQNLGAKKPERAEKSAWLATAIYGAILFVVTLVFLFFGSKIVGFFNNDPEVVARGARLLHLTSPFYSFLALAMVLGGALGGSGDTVPPMVISAISLSGVQVAAALVLPQLFGLNENGLWLAISLGLLTWGGGTALWFHRGRWKQKVL